MARKCDLYGTGITSGHNVSHSKRRTKTTWVPNIQTKKYPLPELGKSVKLHLSGRAIRTINKYGGLVEMLRNTPDARLPKKFRKMKDDLVASGK